MTNPQNVLALPEAPDATELMNALRGVITNPHQPQPHRDLINSCATALVARTTAIRHLRRAVEQHAVQRRVALEALGQPQTEFAVALPDMQPAEVATVTTELPLNEQTRLMIESYEQYTNLLDTYRTQYLTEVLRLMREVQAAGIRLPLVDGGWPRLDI